MQYQLKVLRRTTEVFVFSVEAASLQQAHEIAERMVNDNEPVPVRSSSRVSIEQCHSEPEANGKGAKGTGKDGDA